VIFFLDAGAEQCRMQTGVTELKVPGKDLDPHGALSRLAYKDSSVSPVHSNLPRRRWVICYQEGSHQ
jgi:hypothetical protein